MLTHFLSSEIARLCFDIIIILIFGYDKLIDIAKHIIYEFVKYMYQSPLQRILSILLFYIY